MGTTFHNIQAWEAAVESALENGLVSLDEESALAKYASHFNLTQQGLDGNCVQAAVIRDLTQGIVAQRQNITGRVPFNLMKSEKLVWVIQDVEYLDDRGAPGTPRRLPRAQHQGAQDLYYRPSTFLRAVNKEIVQEMIRTFIQEVLVGSTTATLRYTVPMPSGGPGKEAMTEEVALG